MDLVKMEMLIGVLMVVVGLPSAKGESVAELAGVPGGLAVHVGASDARLALELAGAERWITLVLVRSAPDADKRRDAVFAGGGAGLVTVDVWDGKKLPLADHMANLIVVDPTAEIDQEEVLRALVPGRGRALIGEAGDWKKLEKPMPPEFDEWTHFFHAADGNAVSRDTAIDVPNALRFMAGPRLQDANGANGYRISDAIAVSEWNYTAANSRDRPRLVLEGRGQIQPQRRRAPLCGLVDGP